MLSPPVAAAIAAGIVMVTLFLFMMFDNGRWRQYAPSDQYISPDQAAKIIKSSYKLAEYVDIKPEFGILKYNSTYGSSYKQFLLYKTDSKINTNSDAPMQVIVSKGLYPSITENERPVWFVASGNIPGFHFFLVDAITGEAVGEGDTCIACE